MSLINDLPCMQSLCNWPQLRPSYIPLPRDCPLCRPRYGYQPLYFTWTAPLPPPIFAFCQQPPCPTMPEQ